MPIDLKLLIEPVSESSPCGEDLLFSADFDAIQHARRFDDPSLDQGEWVTDIKEADWSFVVERASALLGSQTKDLRLAVWLTEALAMEDGVPGLTQGYALVTGLCERYWEYLHPLPEGDDAEYRLGNVGWLVGRTAELLRAAPLTQTGDSSFSALDWEVATHAAQAAKRDPEHADDITRGKPAVEQIEASRRATPARFYVSLLAELRAFEEAMLGLERELDLRAGEVAPSFRKAKDAYESVYRLAERFAREAGVNPDAPDGQAARESKQDQTAGAQERTEPTFKTPLSHEAAVPTTLASASQTTHVSNVAYAGIQNRAQAVAQLRAVAKYFRSTEPHSPVAYLADKAAEWADMPLHEWLSTVVKDDGSLSHIRELLGIKPDTNG
ncbi:type VI secretion system protein ImpA [Paraburkholderia kururiensis]|uniref:type VI secretion system protein TssA n=1 Tax=Paraburkholderia kururiensis TaxID=984307 RepID=UPI0039A65E1E